MKRLVCWFFGHRRLVPAKMQTEDKKAWRFCSYCEYCKRYVEQK